MSQTSEMSQMNLIEMNDFNASVSISEQLERMMVNSAQSLAIRSIRECAERYNFDAEEAIRNLGLEYVKMERKSSSKVVGKAKAAPVAKPAFPLPYNGEFNENSCFALRQNNGLYTQCQAIRKGDKSFCKACQALADKSEDNVPEYGTIQQRQATDIFLYVDPKGRKPVAYTKVMKKFKVSMAEVVEEAGKFNIEIHDMHFVEPETETKRGRPKTAKEPKEPKGAKGRPKKAKKVLEIEGDTEDLFASLVANAQNYESESDDEELIMEALATKKGKSEEEKAAKALKKQQEEEAKALKKQQEEQAKAEKKALEELIKQDKELKRQQEKAEKEAKKAAEEEAKALKKQQEEEAKAAKALKKQQEDEAKAAKALKKQPEKAAKASADEVAEQEPDVVKKIEENGKKYLKSKKTGIIYDYAEYTQNGEQVVVGQWNEKKNAIDFKNDEESEEEYESDDE
jgi:chemotaxis protein histidine kinase CheA